MAKTIVVFYASGSVKGKEVAVCSSKTNARARLTVVSAPKNARRSGDVVYTYDSNKMLSGRYELVSAEVWEERQLREDMMEELASLQSYLATEKFNWPDDYVRTWEVSDALRRAWNKGCRTL